jgi:predicted enzyme related to lactoylglutathione lyase
MSTSLPVHAAVWFEIPVSDLAAAKSFYGAVLGSPLVDHDMGPNKVAIFPNENPQIGVAGHVYEGKPADAGKGSTIHLQVTDSLESAMDRVTENKGQVVSDIIAIPAGRFAYCLDPDGNSFGLFK